MRPADSALNPDGLGRRALARRVLGGAVGALIGGAVLASARAVDPAASAAASPFTNNAASPFTNNAASNAASDAGRPGPDLAARFRVSLTPRGRAARVQHWQLSRSEAEISWIKGDGLEEIWRRDGSGIRLLRVLRQDRHLIDYPAGELRVLQVALDWHELGSLFAETDLPLLKPETRPQPRARAVQPLRWAGRIGAEQVDLLWDAAAGLPLRLVRRSPAGQVLFERTALHRVAPAGWPVAGAGTRDFQRLDAADFGDMPDNPVVQKAQAFDQRAGWRHAHGD